MYTYIKNSRKKVSLNTSKHLELLINLVLLIIRFILIDIIIVIEKI